MSNILKGIRLNEVDPRNFDSDIDYYNALNRKPRGRSEDDYVEPYDDEPIKFKQDPNARPQYSISKDEDRQAGYNMTLTVKAPTTQKAQWAAESFVDSEWGAKKQVGKITPVSDGVVQVHMIDNHKYGMWKPWKDEEPTQKPISFGEAKEEDYGPEYQEKVKRVGQRAKELAGGSKTVWDEQTRRYKVVPANSSAQAKTDDNLRAYYAHRKAEKQGVAEGWKEEAQELEDWSKEVNMRLYRAHESQRLGLARQLSKLEQKHFGSEFTHPNLTNIVWSALRALQKGEMVHYDPQRVGQMPFGNIVGDDAKIIAQYNITRDELAGYRMLHDKGMVDNLEQFLKLRRLVRAKSWPLEYFEELEKLTPEEAWLKMANDLNWSKDNMSEELDENLHKWFKEKWVRFGPDGKIRGDCARGDDSEGKPKCLPQSKAHSLGKKGRASAASRKRREDPNPERSGKAINVNTKKTNEEQLDELSCWSGYHRVAGTKAGFPGSCAKNKTNESEHSESCPHCGGEMVSEELMNEKKDACYYKVKSRYKVWPSAYASGALVKCRKKGADSWGNGGKKNESIEEDQLDEKWTKKYKDSINCSNPKGFSQKAHCAGKQKNESAIMSGLKQIDEGWKEKLGAAALAGTMALGSAGASARVTPGDDPNINRLNGKPIAAQQATNTAPTRIDSPNSPSGFSKEYLQRAADPNRFGRYMISVEKAQELLQQMQGK